MKLRYAEDFYIRALLKKIKLQEVMTAPAISVDQGAPFREVVRLLHDQKIRHLPVTNKEREVVGLITQRDLYKIQPPHKNQDDVWVYDFDMIDGIILEHVMIPQPFCLNANKVLAQALDPMVRRKFGCVPIVDDHDKLCGIITQFDILKIAFEILEEGT